VIFRSLFFKMFQILVVVSLLSLVAGGPVTSSKVFLEPLPLPL
jgi:hypothetical protein